MGNNNLLQKGVEESELSITELGLSKSLIKDLGGSHIHSLPELLDLDIYSQKFRFVACESKRKKLIDLIHSLGLKFNCEFDNDYDDYMQDVLIYNIRLVGLSNYMRQHGVMYQATMIDELDFDEHYIGVIRYCTDARNIEELLKLSRNQLSRLFYNKTDLFIEQVHSLGYIFDFEVVKNDLASFDVYVEKKKRLLEIQEQIKSLQMEQKSLTSEVLELENKQLKKMYAKRK